MGRTLRSRKHRAALWRSTGGKCSACGTDLAGEWHADHVIPWVRRKVTNVHEMQPMCATCNLKKGAN